MPIKMTKELPAEAGFYYFSLGRSFYETAIVEVTMVRCELILDEPAYGHHPVRLFNKGCWAKVDIDQFEFEW